MRFSRRVAQRAARTARTGSNVEVRVLVKRSKSSEVKGGQGKSRMHPPAPQHAAPLPLHVRVPYCTLLYPYRMQGSIAPARATRYISSVVVSGLESCSKHRSTACTPVKQNLLSSSLVPVSCPHCGSSTVQVRILLSRRIDCSE